MINYKFNTVERAEALAILVDQKFTPLEKYLVSPDTAVCDVEFEKVTHHQQGNVCRVEVTLKAGGVVYRAEATEETFERAIDVVRNELDTELVRSKQKTESLSRKMARKIKAAVLGQ